MAISPSLDTPSVSRRVSQRVAGVAPSATLAIDAKAKQLQAQGVDVVGFGAGEPDFPTPAAIVAAAVAACGDARNYRYTPTGGLPELKEAIVNKTARDSHYEIGAKQVVVTNGGKHAVYNAFASLLDPGDEVLLPAPYWTTYPEPVRLSGGVVVEVPTGVASGFKVTAEQLEAAASERTKLLVFVSPSNPSGAVYSRDQIAEIGRLAAERGWWVLTDEIYEHLVYGDHTQHSMPVVVPELADRCVIANGVAKTYAMTGWRVGWLDRADRLRRSRHEPAVAPDLECQQHRPAGHDRRLDGRPVGRRGDEGRLRPTPPDHLRAAVRYRRCHLPRARGRLLCLPLLRGCPRARDQGSQAEDDARAGRARARRGPSRLRAGRGVRGARLWSFLLRLVGR